MPAKSKEQRKAAGIARAIQKGEMKAKPGTPSAEMAKMKPSSLRGFAKTKEKGLPEKKKKGKGKMAFKGESMRFQPKSKRYA